MFSMCSELTPRPRIPDTGIPQLMQPRIPQLMQPWITVAHISVIMAAQEKGNRWGERADLRIQCGGGVEIKHISAHTETTTQLVKNGQNRRDCTKKTDKNAL